MSGSGSRAGIGTGLTTVKDHPPLACRGVWKIFGDNPVGARLLADEGGGSKQILDATGCVVAVRDVSFRVRRGETFVVMGLSGSGKSTLIRCLSRLVEPTHGEVLIDGEPIGNLDPDALRALRRHRMSMVFQHFGLFPHRRVLDNVAFGLEVQGMPKAERYERAFNVLESVGLEAWSDHHPQQLSGGMQQRVGLARALCVEPEILFFDEPFSALDPLIRRDMQDELLSLQARMHRTLVFITHDFQEALKLGDRIAIMKDGLFMQLGTPEEIVSAPADDYVREFTKDAPKVKVVTVGKVLGPLDPQARVQHSVTADTVLEEVLPLLLASPEPVGILDRSGRLIGQVERSAVSQLVGG